MKKQTSWEIIYNEYKGITKKAVDFLNKEASRFLIREAGIYTLHVLPCFREGKRITENAFIVGVYGKSEEIRRYVTPEEVKNGYLIKIVENPVAPGGRLVILTSEEAIGVYYACVDFFDVFVPEFSPFRGEAMQVPENFFDETLPTVSRFSPLPRVARSIFTWGHVINDYREYIDNIARLKYDRLIIWNDRLPINSEDVVSYAHEYGMKLIWGFAWGWSTEISSMTDLGDGYLDGLKKQIIGEYEEYYAPSGCDGIYFQSFTEINRERIGGRLIAEAVTKLVNDVTRELLGRHPKLTVQFGLHAMSVRNQLEYIANVDERVEILWEDGGDFPFAYRAHIKSEESFAETLAFLGKILSLRQSAPTGVVIKGMTVLDWTRFVHQAGPYVLGCNDRSVTENDKKLRYGARRLFNAEWTVNGRYAYEFVKYAFDNSACPLEFCVAASLDGGIRFPEALCAEMFCNADREYDEIVRLTAAKPCLTFE